MFSSQADGVKMVFIVLQTQASRLHAWDSYYNHNVCMLLTTHKHTEPLHVYSIYLFSCFEFYVSFLCHNAILRNLEFQSVIPPPPKKEFVFIIPSLDVTLESLTLGWPRIIISVTSDLLCQHRHKKKQDIYLNDDFQTCFIKKLRHMQQSCSYPFVMWQKHKIQ